MNATVIRSALNDAKIQLKAYAKLQTLQTRQRVIAPSILRAIEKIDKALDELAGAGTKKPTKKR